MFLQKNLVVLSLKVKFLATESGIGCNMVHSGLLSTGTLAVTYSLACMCLISTKVGAQPSSLILATKCMYC